MAEAAARGVLVTRPEPGASETAARLLRLGWEPVMAPVARIVPRAIAVPAQAQAVLVTSGNAVSALPQALFAQPLYAVGDATADRARLTGFGDVHSAGADAAALAALVRKECRPGDGALLLASGAGQGLGLARDLRAAGFRVLRRVAYAALAVRALPAPAIVALRGRHVAAALVFSPESGRRLVALLRAADIDVADIDAIAISPAVKSALTPLPWRSIRVASHPEQDALLGLLP